MKENIKEIYAKEGKELTELIQEWINENIDNILAKQRQQSYNASKRDR